MKGTLFHMCEFGLHNSRNSGIHQSVWGGVCNTERELAIERGSLKPFNTLFSQLYPAPEKNEPHIQRFTEEARIHVRNLTSKIRN